MSKRSGELRLVQMCINVGLRIKTWCNHIAQVTGGRNGYGAKLANIFSSEFTVETCDGHRSRRYKQVTQMWLSQVPSILLLVEAVLLSICFLTANHRLSTTVSSFKSHQYATDIVDLHTITCINLPYSLPTCHAGVQCQHEQKERTTHHIVQAQ